MKKQSPFTLSGNNTANLNVLFAMLERIERKIDKLDKQGNLNKEYLTTHEACIYLGCTRTMVWKLVKAGKLNRLKLENGRTYYATAELKHVIECPLPAEAA
jgi:excisionase family DNA binding protein